MTFTYMPHYDDFVLRQVNAFVGLVPSVSLGCSDQKYILNCQIFVSQLAGDGGFSRGCMGARGPL